MKYRVVIVDDHKIFRDGFRLATRYINNAIFAGEAVNGGDFLQLLETAYPEVVFIDVDMPNMNGIKATEKALVINPKLKIIALSSYCDIATIKNMIKAGVEGYMLKNSEITEIEKAIDRVMNGNNYFSPEVLMLLARDAMNPYKDRKINEGVDELTEREQEVLELMCLGMGMGEIALKLKISERTVEKHKEKLLTKTHAKNSINLVLWALRHHIAVI